MSLFQSLFLGFVQGITEFLPVSSSGHLVVFQEFFNLASLPLFFDVFLHAATLGVVVLFFRKEICSMVRMCCAPAQWKSSADVRMFMFVFLGSIPTALIGFFAKDFFEQFFHSIFITGWMFFVTAGLLASTSLRKSTGHGIMAIKPYSAFFIGCIQGLALFPGISRSGATISLAILLGWERKAAFTFSFLLFIPAALGALILEGADYLKQGAGGIPVIWWIGLAAAFIAGLGALHILGKTVQQRKLSYFSWYCLFLGIVVIIKSLL